MLGQGQNDGWMDGWIGICMLTLQLEWIWICVCVCVFVCETV